MATIDSLDIKISAEVNKANQAINSLVKNLEKLSTSLKFDTDNLEKLGNINGNNFKKLGEGLQSFANAAKSLNGISKTNFNKLASGIERIASIDSYKLEALGRIDGNSFRGLGEGVKALSSGLQNLQGIKKSDFNRLATGIERLASMQPGNIEVVGNAIKPLADGINALSNTNFDNKNLQNLINSLSRLSNSNVSGLANVDFSTLGNSIKGLAETLSGADKVEQNTISMTNAIAKLASAGQNANITAEALPNFATKLRDFIQTMSEAPKLETDTIAFAQALAQLANAGKKTEATASGLPVLGDNLKKVFDTMSHAPTISQSTIQFTQALAQLASAGGRANNTISSLNSTTGKFSASMNGLKSSAKNAVTGIKSLSRQILSSMGIYVGIYGIVRGIKSSIMNSMDYIENLNYFNAAFGQVAENAVSQWGESGYSSAEEYYNSFSKRAEELTAKMTGFSVGESGRLESTGMINLGINPTTLMNYQATFAQMSSSMGVTSETALLLSNALTEIGADLASVKNMDFDKVWEDMASGLAGMSRTLDKYGVNIRNVNLQQKLNELGIDANITALNQNEKALLRTIILLDSTKYAWGDLSRTLDQPANQLRLLKSNFSNLGRSIGNIFLPIFSKVIPYVNAAVIALQRLADWLVKVFGFEGFEWGGIGEASFDMSQLYDDADNLSDSLSDATDKAKKLKNELMGFDEINKLSDDTESTSSKDTGTGIGNGLLDEALKKSVSEYQKAWDKAFGNLENRAQEIADKIEKIFEPIKKIIQDFAVGDFFQAGKDTSALVAGIFNFFAEAIDRVDWYGIGQKIGDFLAGIDWFAIFASIGKLIWESINAGIELWAGMFDKAPFETAFLSILALPGIVGFGKKFINLLVNPFKNIFKLISPIISGIGGLFAEGGIFGAGGLIASASVPVLALTAAFSTLVVGLGYVFATNEEVRESFSKAISAIREGLQPAIEFLAETLLPDLRAGWNRLLEILTPLGEFLESMFTSIWQDMINPALTYIGETVLPMVTETFENLWNNVLVPFASFLGDVLEPVVQVVADVLSVLWKNVVVPLAGVIVNVFSKAFEVLCGIFNNLVIPVVNAIINVFQFLWNNVFSPIVNFLRNTLKPVFESVFEGIKGIINGLSKAFGGLIDFVTGVFSEGWRKAWEGVKSIFSGIWDMLVFAAKAPLDGVLSLFERLANGIIDAWNWIKKQLNKVSIDIPDWVPGVGGKKFGFDFDMSDHINLPKLATGGIVYRTTFAEIGEEGAEAVLPLSNGTTMRKLVNEIMMSAGEKGNYGQSIDEDYLSKIEEATYRGMIRAMRVAGGIKAEATFKVEGDRDRIFKITQEEANNYFKKTGKPAYNF